ncbi:MAG: DDE transposase family protein [Cyanobacteria bacterium J06627_8]
MADDKQSWYIVQRDPGHCDIVSSVETDMGNEQPSQWWGPFDSEGEAIAKRVGLIRAGKCKPIID